MTLFHTVPLASGLVLAFLGAAQAQPANRPEAARTSILPTMRQSFTDLR